MYKKVILITGANRGIGFATAKKFLDEGDIVIFTARNEKFYQTLIEKFGLLENLFFHQLDIVKDSSVEKIRKYVEEKFGRLDILINNAGINYDTWQNPLNADLNLVIDTINVNTIGAWRMCKAFIPLMQKNNYGRIINVSSGAGSLSGMGYGVPAYGVSKAALNAVTIKFAKLLDDSNILVNALCPGWVKTDMGGEEASKLPEDAAEDIYWLANNDMLNGKFIRERKEINF